MSAPTTMREFSMSRLAVSASSVRGRTPVAADHESPRRTSRRRSGPRRRLRAGAGVHRRDAQTRRRERPLNATGLRRVGVQPHGRSRCGGRSFAAPFWLIGEWHAILDPFHRRPSVTEKSVEGPGLPGGPRRRTRQFSRPVPSASGRSSFSGPSAAARRRTNTNREEAGMARPDKVAAVDEIADQFRARPPRSSPSTAASPSRS